MKKINAVIISFILILIFLSYQNCDSPENPGEVLPCNGDENYCNVPYNELTVACTHNAMSNNEDWDGCIPTCNQKYSFIRQLNDGVRAMMLDAYPYQDDIYLCHASCLLGKTRFSDMLVELKGWMDANPRQVITFIMQMEGVGADGMKSVLQQSGMWDLVYHHNIAPGGLWPTIGQMIERNERLVIFANDRDDLNGDWYLEQDMYGFENPYDDETFSCDLIRGDPTRYPNQVFVLNHYVLCALGSCASNGEQYNIYTFMYDRVKRCSQYDPVNNPYAQYPTFINIDHYEVPLPGEKSEDADIFDVVRDINRLRDN